MQDWYARRIRPWTDNAFGLDMEAASRLLANSWSHGRVTRDNLLTEPERWATLDYAVVEEPDARARVTWTVTRSGTGHGLAAGFERTVCDGVIISNLPGTPDASRHVVYGTVFLPWLMPVPLDVGDVVTVDLEARLIRGDYIWNWKTRVSNPGQSGADKANFTQSTFFGLPLSPATLQTIAESHTPALSEDGRIARCVLESMDDGMSLGDIARLVSTGFSARFPRPEDALTHVAGLSRQYADSRSLRGSG
jgi:hypothetical protein